jgi:hypothetical protein
MSEKPKGAFWDLNLKRVALLLLIPAAIVGFGWCWFYGPATLKTFSGPPKNAFPGSVAYIDGEGHLDWWGCLKLTSGDVREVGSYNSRALLFIPGGTCNRNPDLPRTPPHLVVTWRLQKETDRAPLEQLDIIVSAECPAHVSSASREEAARLINEYLTDPRGLARYRAAAVAAHALVADISSTKLTRREVSTGEFRDYGIWMANRDHSHKYWICAGSPA